MSFEPLAVFDNAPITEVVLSIQFSKLERLNAPQIGALWSLYKHEFPLCDQQPPVEHTVESFAPILMRPSVKLRVIDGPPPAPRCWFLREDESQLIQIQSDRFIHNWRKTSHVDEYPHYKDIRPAFGKEFATFRNYLRENGIGALNVDQCEVTYINHIEPNEFWSNHSDLDRVLVTRSNEYQNKLESTLENVTVSERRIITDNDQNPIGRLHISAEPAFRPDESPIYVLTLLARLSPFGQDDALVMGTLDAGRKQIAEAFLAITTKSMHQAWKRKR